MSARLLLLLCLVLGGCASSPPRQSENICEIFAEKHAWHRAAQKAEQRWGAPLAIPMAIMFQESGFRSKARPPMRWALGFVPLGRGSSAFGYSQAKSAAWDDYQSESGNGWSDRDDFNDAMDFIQWYIDKSHRLNGTARTDAFALYLNYHEGWGGYRRGSWRGNSALIGIARKVEARATRYKQQYAQCRERLERGWLRRILD